MKHKKLDKAMESGDHFKNGTSLKSQMSRENFLRKVCYAVVVTVVFTSCSGGNKPAQSVGGDEPVQSIVSSVHDLKVIERELDAMNTEILDTIEIADRMRKSVRNSKYNTLVFSDGWVFYLYDRWSEDNPLPYFPAGVCDNFLYRVRLSDFKADSILCNNNYFSLCAVDRYWVFYMEHGYLYKQHIRSNERIFLKEINYLRDNNRGNVIVFNDRVYYTQVEDNIEDGKAGDMDIIACVKTDGSDDKILTKPFYRDFCIYNGMIFARNYLYELEKLDLNGNKIDNYGKIGSIFFDVYEDFIYFISDNNGGIYKIDINTKKKQFVYNNNSFSFENSFIAYNHLFFNTNKSSIQKNDPNSFSFARTFGNLCCVNLKTGKMKKIYSEHDCELIGVYNGVLYGKEFIMSDATNKSGSLVKFQINIDGTGKKNFQ